MNRTTPQPTFNRNAGQCPPSARLAGHLKLWHTRYFEGRGGSALTARLVC
jgi:hypothetical protein